ncbi:hypothetical protein Aperf_G00000127711 [Anoplocephala perfoliata]
MELSEKAEVIVDFNGKSIKADSEKDAEEIVKAIKGSDSMTALRLSGNTLGVDAAKAIGSELASQKSLKRCLFSDIFTSRLVDEIAPALIHISKGLTSSGARLTELDLSDNAFGPRGVVGVTELLCSPACSTLKVLRMNNQGLGHQGAKYLADALAKGISETGGKGLRLVHFSAGRNRLENYGVCLLADVFAQMGSLEELFLYQNGIGIHGSEGVKALAFAISKNTRMRILNLSDNSLKEEGGSEVAKILKSIPHLEELILDDCLIRSRGCRALAHYLEREDIVPGLARLSLYGNEIKRDAAISLAFALGSKTNLTYLSLNANEFGASGVDNLLQVLGSVNLLPAIRAATRSLAEEEDNGNDETGDLLLAFDEDTGEDNEEVYEDDDDVEDDYDDDYDDDDTESNDIEEEDDGEQDSSFNTVKNMLVKTDKPTSGETTLEADKSGTGGFSFRSCLSSLKENQQPKSNLFADIKLAGGTSTTDRGLFGSLGTTTFSPGGLFAPKLGLAASANPSANFNESALLDSIKAAIEDTEDDKTLESLLDQITKQAPPLNWVFQLEKVGSTLSEPVVRLAFRICQKSSITASRNLASLLLYTALCHKSDDGVENKSICFIPPASRAVNFILLHLKAIKPDRSDPLERKILQETDDYQNLNCNINLVTSLLNRYGNDLSTDVKKPLTLLISQHRNQNTALETLLTALEGKMSTLSL